MNLPEKLVREIENLTKDIPEKLRREIYERVEEEYKKALVDTGEPVGLVAAQSISEPTTQMILRSFHFVGMAELQITLGLPRFIEIIDGRKKIKERYMTVYLKNKYKNNQEVAKNLAKKLKEVKISTIAKRITTDIVNKEIEVELDEKILKELDLSDSDVLSIVSKKLKRIDVKKRGNSIILKFPEKMSMKDFYQNKERVLDTTLYGIKGIKDVLIKMENGEYVIYTYGSNLEEVLKLEEVDETRTFSNDIHEVERVLGIEAAREVIVREIIKIMETQGLDVDIRHILLLADVLTWYGKYMGVTRYGVQAEKGSALARAAFETPIRHFMLAAKLGEEDSLITAIENVMTNQPIPYGSNMFRLYYIGKPKKSSNRKKK